AVLTAPAHRPRAARTKTPITMACPTRRIAARRAPRVRRPTPSARAAPTATPTRTVCSTTPTNAAHSRAVYAPTPPVRGARRPNGCPGLTLVRDGQILIQRPVFFAPRRDRILPRSRAVLDSVAEAMLASPDIERLSIEGHTDDIGDDAQNLELSQRRAANVLA